MLDQIIKKLESQGAEVRFVGGAVRDEIMGIPNKDFDIEVGMLSIKELETLLSEFGKTSLVGASFGVIKLRVGNDELDFSVPRRDNKIGKSHKDFEIEVDPFMTAIEAAKRRDFTVNSMWKDSKGNIFDPFDGIEDIKNRILQHTSEQFAEDPLRVLRGMQFAGRFNMTLAKETAKLCRELRDEIHHLPKERIWAEWYKWAEKSVKPSMGLKLLVDTNWITWFPELLDLIECHQDNEWHPEGDVFAHTCHVVDEMALICDRDGIIGSHRAVQIFQALTHDFGKPSTTVFERDHWRSPGHDKAGEQPIRSFMARIGAPIGVTEACVDSTKEHMVHLQEVNARTVRRLLVRLQSTDLLSLVRVIEADHNGRPPLPKGLPEQAKLVLELFEKEKDKVTPILMGRHLIEKGLTPSPQFSVILKEAFQAQIEGEFDSLEGALVWLGEQE